MVAAKGLILLLLLVATTEVSKNLSRHIVGFYFKRILLDFI